MNGQMLKGSGEMERELAGHFHPCVFPWSNSCRLICFGSVGRLWPLRVFSANSPRTASEILPFGGLRTDLGSRLREVIAPLFASLALEGVSDFLEASPASPLQQEMGNLSLLPRSQHTG